MGTEQSAGQSLAETAEQGLRALPARVRVGRLLAILALFGAALLAGYVLASRRGPLARAADVIMAPDPQTRAVAPTADGPGVPLPPYVFDRAMLVSLAVDARTRDYSEADLATAAGAVLKLDAARARCVVRALGLVDPEEDLPEAVLAAARPAPSWEAVREALMETYDLSSERAEQVRAAVCREAVAAAFEAEGGLSAAGETLGRFAALIPAQIDAVLTMAAAIRLVDAGRGSCGQIARIDAKYPDRAEPLADAVGCDVD